MAELAVNKLIKIILGIVVVGVVIVGLYFFFKNNVLDFFKNLAGDFWLR
jgi:hypothetical protein